MLEIPKNIQKEISLIEKGKKIKKREKREPFYPQEELFSMAMKNLRFLDEVANTEPVHSFLQGSDYSARIIMILDNFNTTYPQPKPQDNMGRLVLTVIYGLASLYDWVDADYPINRSYRDYVRVTYQGLEEWDPSSLKQFALLTEKDIWKSIFQWLRIMRSH